MTKESSTRQKGDTFEKLVFTKLDELIKSQAVPGVSRYYHIFLHKQYASNMPKNPFFLDVYKLFKEYRITKGWLYHDNQPCNIRDCNVIVETLSSNYNVSQEAVIVRLKHKNLYREGDRCKPLHEQMRHNSWWL